MSRADVHRIQLELPKAWLPELEALAKSEDRSRHYLILQMIRSSLDAAANGSGPAVKVEPGRVFINGDQIPKKPAASSSSAPNQLGMKDVTPRLKKASS